MGYLPCEGDSLRLREVHTYKVMSVSESDISDIVARRYKGQREVTCTSGRCDVVNDEYAIEVKNIKDWKGAIGQALCYSIDLDRKPMIYLFDDADPRKRAIIEERCSRLCVSVVFHQDYKQAHVHQEPVVLPTNIFGTRTWRDVSMNIRNVRDKSEVLRLMRSSIAHILDGLGFFILNSEDGLDIIASRSFLSSLKNINLNASIGKSLYDILHEYMSVVSYSSVEYRLSPCTEHTRVNLFFRHRANDSDIIDPSIKIILKYIRDIQCRGRTDLYEYVINWMSFVVQRTEKIRTSILMKRKYNISKFWEFFAEKIMGKHNATVIADHTHIISVHNNLIHNKRLIVASEVGSMTKSHQMKMNCIITNSNIDVKFKNIGVLPIPSVHCILMCTENMRYTPTEIQRLLVLEYDDSSSDREYFVRLSEVMNDHVDSLYTWLKRRNISEYDPDNIPTI